MQRERYPISGDLHCCWYADTTVNILRAPFTHIFASHQPVPQSHLRCISNPVTETARLSPSAVLTTAQQSSTCLFKVTFFESIVIYIFLSLSAKVDNAATAVGSSAKWFKIFQSGLITDNPIPGYWGSMYFLIPYLLQDIEEIIQTMR